MKKFAQLLPAVAIAVILFAGCAKERNNYDKWLTSSMWNLSTYTNDNKMVTTKTYAANTPANNTNTTETTDNTAAGANKNVYTTTQVTNTGTTWQKSTSNTTTTTTVQFNKDGTYTSTTTTTPVSSEYDTESVPGTLVNAVAPTAATSSNTGTWSWGNDADTKQLLNLSGWGTVQVTIKKGSLTLNLVTGSENQFTGTDFNGTYNEDQKSNQTQSWNLTN